MPKAELEELVVSDAETLRAWLLDHHTTSPGVWLALTRKGGRLTTLTWQQAVDEALCVGWIDGQARKRDEETSLIRFTPGGPRSSWSQRNVGHVARLEMDGRMLPAGRAAVATARADGRWQAAYAPQSEAEVPAAFAAAIAANPAAQAMFDVLTKANRFALINGEAGRDARAKDRRVRRDARSPRDDLPSDSEACGPDMMRIRNLTDHDRNCRLGAPAVQTRSPGMRSIASLACSTQPSVTDQSQHVRWRRASPHLHPGVLISQRTGRLD